jgi:GNAT superfamily N-acetyltransferase
MTRHDETRERARIAFEHHLYFSRNWVLHDDLISAQQHPEHYQVELHYVDEVPVGVLLIERAYFVRDGEGKLLSLRHRVFTPNIFVHKDYRRQGIGSTLMGQVRDPHHMRGSKGLKCGDAFWRKLLIPPHTAWAGKAPEAWVY